MITMRDVFEKNTEIVIDRLREEKQAWLKTTTSTGKHILLPTAVKAFRYKEDADFIQIIDSDGNFWCVYYAPGIGVFIEDSMPKPPMPGEGWELLSWV